MKESSMTAGLRPQVRFVLALLGCLLAVHCASGPCHAQGNPQFSLNAIIDAWIEREARVGTFDFSLKGNEFKRATKVSEWQMGAMHGLASKVKGDISLPD